MLAFEFGRVLPQQQPDPTNPKARISTRPLRIGDAKLTLYNERIPGTTIALNAPSESLKVGIVISIIIYLRQCKIHQLVPLPQFEALLAQQGCWGNALGRNTIKRHTLNPNDSFLSK